MNQSQDLQDFRTLATKWAPSYRSRAVTALAFRAEGQWHLRYARTVFSIDRAGTDSFTVKTASVLAVRRAQLLDASSARHAVAAAAEHPTRIAVDDDVLEIVPGSLPEPTSVFFQRLSVPHPADTRRPTLVIKESPTTAPPFPSGLVLAEELLGHRPSIDGLTDLLAELQIPSQHRDVVREALIEITLCPPARFEPTSALANGTVELALRAGGSIAPSDLRIDLQIFLAPDRPTRVSIKSNHIDWRQGDYGSIGQCRIDVGVTPRVVAFLAYDSDHLGRFELRDRSLSYNRWCQLHRIRDRANHVGTELQKEKPKEFEKLVTILFAILGFRIFPYGRINKLDDGPDIVAALDEGHVLVVECTVGDINPKGKLGRLWSRTEDMKAALEPWFPEAKLLPVMVTSLRRQQTMSSWNEMADNGVALVCHEEIAALLNAWESPPSPDTIYRQLGAWIPAHDHGGPELRAG